MYPCEIKNLAAQPVLVVRTRTAAQNLPAVLGQSYVQVLQRLAHLGEDPAGPPFVAYFNMDANDLDVQIGFPVRVVLDGEAPVQADEIPAGAYATTVYTGPYSAIEPAYTALTDFVIAQGRSVGQAAYEFYLNDPANTAPEDLRTQIFYSLND